MTNKNQEISDSETIVLLGKNHQEIVPIDRKKKRKFKKRAKNLFFLFIWLYFLCKVFVIDIDATIIEYLTKIDLNIYVTLRILILPLLLIIIWLKIGNKRFWKNVGLFFLFPLFPSLWLFAKYILWRVPKFLLNHQIHILLYYYIENIIGFFVNFKYIMLRLLLIILGFVTLIKLSSYGLIFTIIIFGFLQINHLYRRFKQTFSPIKIFRMSIDGIFDSKKSPISPDKLEEIISDTNKKDDTDEKKKMRQMEGFLIINEFAKVFNIKLKEIVNNRIYMLSFLGKSIFSFIIAMF